MLSIFNAKGSAVALLGAEGIGCSYVQLAETLSRNSNNLEILGVHHRILTILPDDPTTAVAIASICLDATVIPANPNLTLFELEKLAIDSGAQTIVTLDDPACIGKALAEITSLGQVILEPHRNQHFADFDFQIISHSTQETANDDNFAIILPTSGSTGTPKLVPHTLDSLITSAKSIAKTLELGPDDTCIHILPMFHIGAVVDLFLAPLLSGGRVRFSHSAPPKAMAENILEAQATWIQGVPTMLYAIINAVDSDTLLEVGRSLRFIRSVSSDLAPPRQSEVEKSFGGIPVIQMYGMTETAGQICSNPLPPHPRKPGSVGPAQAPDITILDQFGNHVAGGSVGEVCVKGPTVMQGYLDLEDQQYFFSKWLRTGDLGKLDEDGYLFLQGRIKDMINRGGEKISALEIEQCALQIPSVLEAACVPIPHTTLGEEVGITIISADTQLTQETVQEAMSQQLAAFKVPRTVLFKETIPKLGSGKIDKSALAAEFNNQSAPESSEKPASALGKIIADIWVKSLNAPYPTSQDDFFDAGGDSLSAQTFMMELEKALDKPLPSNLLYEAPTFTELEETLSSLDALTPSMANETELPEEVMKLARRGMAGWRGARRNASSLIVELSGAGEKTPFFFCTPTEASFTDLHAALDADRPFYAMRTLWLQDGRSVESEEKLSQHYATEICDQQPTGGILLGGHCRGVEMARMIARALTHAGRNIALLVELDYPINDIYRGPVAQVWSNDHPLSWEFSEPQRWNDYHYTGPVTYKHFNIAHNKITRAETAREVARVLDPLMDQVTSKEGHETLAPATAVQDILDRANTRRQFHSANVRIKTPKFATQGEVFQVRAQITNTSQKIWEPSNVSGLRLLARWQRPNKSLLRSLAAACDLETSVQPGETIELTFSVKFHRHTTPLFLYVDMVDEGVCWFNETSGKPARKLIVPRYWQKIGG